MIAPAASVEIVERGIEIDPLGPASASIMRAKSGTASKSGQTATAPSRRLNRPSGTSTAGLAPCCTPSPWQTGHQPSGLLNEK